MNFCLLGFQQKNIITAEKGRQTQNYLRLLITGTKSEILQYQQVLNKMVFADSTIPYAEACGFMGSSWRIMIRVHERDFHKMYQRFVIPPLLLRGYSLYSEYSVINYVNPSENTSKVMVLNEHQIQHLNCMDLQLFSPNKAFDNYLRENGGYGANKSNLGHLYLAVAC